MSKPYVIEVITEPVGAPYRDFLRAGLVDEISLVVAPFADGDPTQPGLFTAVEPLSESHPHSFSLIEARALRDSVFPLRYRVQPSADDPQSADLPKGHHGTD